MKIWVSKILSSSNPSPEWENIVFPLWFPGQWFGLFLRKNVHGHFGSPRALGLKSGYWFPFGPCPTAGLKSVISVCILDYKANTFSLQNVQSPRRHLKQKGTWLCALASWQILVPRKNQWNWRIFSQMPSLYKHTLHTDVIIQTQMF